MHKKLVIALLFFILVIGAVLRIWNLSENPAGFFVDEASTGLNAYSILTTGTDTHGKAFPIIFEAVGDYRDPVMIYSTIPFVWIFGLNEFAVRLASAVYGIATILMMYLVTKEYINGRVAIWSALLLAISPWHVHFSRVGFQLIASIFWLLFSLYFIHKSFKNKYYYALAALGFLITFFTYSTTKMYMPFIFLFLISCYPLAFLKLFKNSYFWIVSLITVMLLGALLFPSLSEGTFFKRWTQVKQDFTLSEVSVAYINHFSPDFLFVSGDAGFHGQDVKRHSIIGVGELYWFQIPFLFIAFSAFIIDKNKRLSLLFFMMLLFIYPFGSIFTQISPQATRSIIGVIPFTLLTAYGIEELMKIIHPHFFQKLYYVSIGLTVSISLFLFVVALRNYPLQGADYWGWQYGYKPAMQLLSDQSEHYDNLYITHRFNMGLELLNFYNYQYPCQNCSVMHNPIEIDQAKKQLFVLRPADIVEAAELYPSLAFHTEDVIRLPNGNIELYIGKFKPIR